MTSANRKKRTVGRSVPATQNRTKKQATIKTALSEEAVDALQILRLMLISSLVNQKRKDKSEHPEIRGFDEEGSAFLSDRTGLPKRKCFSKPDHMKTITDLYKTIPAQFHPKKWAQLLTNIK